MRLGNLSLVLISLFSLWPFSLNAEPIKGRLVEIQVLDKITAKVENLEINVNESLVFGSLNIEIYYELWNILIYLVIW